MLSNLPRQLRFDQERLHFTSGAVNNLRLISDVRAGVTLAQKQTLARRRPTPIRGSGRSALNRVSFDKEISPSGREIENTISTGELDLCLMSGLRAAGATGRKII